MWLYSMNYKLSSLVEEDKMSMVNTIHLGGGGVLKKGQMLFMTLNIPI